MATFNYGITIKMIKKDYYASQEELVSVLMSVIQRHNGVLVDYTFEYDSIERLHLHGSFMARKGIRLNLFKKQYYTIHIDPLYTIDDVQQWSYYIHKGDDKQFHQDIKDGIYLFQD